MTSSSPSRSAHWLAPVIATSLAIATLLLFLPARHFDFLNWDDLSYVAQNDYVKSGVTTEGIRWAFTKSHSGNWHPLTWISHMVDCQLFGLKPMGHHVTNVLFHSANAALLLLLLRKLTGSVWRSALVAAVFAVHPLRVESVGWISERKDVLSTFFGLLSLMAYSNYVSGVRCEVSGKDQSTVRSPESKVQSPKSKVWYGATLVLFALGLMSKPMLVTWPFVLLLLDYWPLKRTTGNTSPLPSPQSGEGDGWQVTGKAWRELVVEKIPFFALAAVSCVVTFLAQKQGGAVATIEMMSPLARIENAVVACYKYLTLLVWPADLSPIYTHRQSWETGTVVIAMAVLAMISGTAWFFRKRWPFVITGWLWYLGTLVPVIGIIQVGPQAYSDRYTYVPMIGLTIALVWLASALAERFRVPRIVLAFASIAVIAALAVRTTQQLPYWQNTETLFRRALALYPDTPHALHALGGYLMDEGQFEEGKRLLEKAIKLQPAYPEALGALAYRFDTRGEYEDAVKFYKAALAAQSDHPNILNNFAWLRASCTNAVFRNGDEAVRLATRACELTGYTKPLLIGTLAAAQAEAGSFQTAITTAERAAKLADSLQLQETVVRNRELIELYRQGKAAHGGEPKRN